MRITLETERILRKVLYAALRDEDDEFEAQLEELAAAGGLAAGCARATDLTALMILKTYESLPTEEIIQRLAADTALHSQWSGFTEDEYAAYLKAIFTGSSMEKVLPLGAALRVPFIQCAHLLMMWHEPNEYWYDYLDRVWEQIETRSNPS